MAGLSALVHTFSEFQWDHRLKERRDPSFFMERLKLLSCLLYAHAYFTMGYIIYISICS